MINNATTAGADVRPLPTAADIEVDLIFAIDPFHDAVTAFGIAIKAFDHAFVASRHPDPGLRAAMTLVRATTTMVTERSAVLEEAVHALLKARISAS